MPSFGRLRLLVALVVLATSGGAASAAAAGAETAPVPVEPTGKTVTISVREVSASSARPRSPPATSWKSSTGPTRSASGR
jgi:hypothetical protein